MKEKKLLRDSYGKVNYINLPYENTGSVSNIQTKINNDKLDKSLKKLSDTLDDLYEKSNINEFFKKQIEID